MTDKLIEVRDLSLRIPGTGNSQLSLLSNVSFDIEKGETVALVGESGSGKSMTAFSLIKLLPETLAPRLTGSVRFRGAEVLAMSDRALQSLRGNKITMIFQEPMTSLNPLTPVGKQIAENIRTHRKVSHKAAMQEALELLRQVKMPDPETRMTSYPHQLSGGQRQRVMIAMAVANKPDLLIADEPTTALDVTTQAQILELLKGLQQDYGMAILFITHDLGVVRAFADRVCVMKTGEIVETGVVSEIFHAPKAAYTRHLLESEPKGRKPPVSPDAPVVLDVKDLRVTFHQPVGILGRKRQIRALDGVSLTLRQGQTLAVVGESGAGKSTVGKATLQLTKCQGEITFLGKEIDTRSRAGMRAFRRNMQVVFQDPYGALSPRMSIGEFITEPLLVHRPELSKKQRYDIASRLLSEVS